MILAIYKARRALYLFLFSFLPYVAIAQPSEIPDTLEGMELREWLRIKHDSVHRIIPYKDGRILAFDSIYNHQDTVVDVYGGYKYYWASKDDNEHQNTDLLLTFEHTVPRSFYQIEEDKWAEPMFSDMHHLFPALGKWNSTRKNYHLVEIPDHETTKWMKDADSNQSRPTKDIHEYSEYNDKRFEPRDGHKGNCARAIFYFYTMYPLSEYDSITEDIDAVADLNTLYRWHLMDPPDSLEKHRNDWIAKRQGSRNPYIDYPELVAKAWDVEYIDLVPPQNFQVNVTSNSIDFEWENRGDELHYYIFRSKDGNTYKLHKVQGSTDSVYSDRSISFDTAYTYYATSVYKTGISRSTDTLTLQLPHRGNEPDLFFSEYIEGSGFYNKALEIANFTGREIDLAAYSINTRKGGTAPWINEGNDMLQLQGILNTSDVFVIVRSPQSDQKIISVSDTIFTGESLNFSGDDIIGLFKNGILIDVIGYEEDDSIFAENMTMVRKSSILSPSPTYLPSEWDRYQEDSFQFLGYHSTNTQTNIPKNKSLNSLYPLIYPNPFDRQLTLSFDLPSEMQRHDIRVAIRNVQGQHIQQLTQKVLDTQQKTFSQTWETSFLSSGLYFLTIDMGERQQSFKVWKR